MSKLTPLWLGLICLFLGGIIFLSEKKWRSTDELKQQKKRLFEVNPELIDRIAIRSPGEDVKLVKKKGKWRIQEPIDYPANQEAVNALLSDLEYLEAIQIFELKNPEKEVAQYGLKNPKFVLRANWGEDQIELRTGRETALTNAVYAQSQKGASEVRVIDRAIVDRLAQDFQVWRDRQALEFDPNQVGKIILRNSTKQLELQKKKDGWYLIRPLYARASDPLIQDLLQKLYESKIESFVSDDNSNVSAWGLTEPQIRVQLFSENKKEKVAVLQIGNPDPETPSFLFARRGSDKAVFTLPTNILETLTLNIDAYRDKKIARFEPPDVTGIRIFKEGSLVQQATLTNGIWKDLNATNSPELNRLAIEDFLKRLQALEANRLVSETSANLESYGLLVPQFRLELQLPKQVMTLSFSEVQNNERFVVLDQEPFVVSVLAHHTDFIALKPWDWESLQVSQQDSKMISEFQIEKKGITNTYQKQGAHWVNSQGTKVDSAGAESIIQLASNLRAKQWIGTNLISHAQADWLIRWKLPESRELRLWRKDQTTIGFFEGEKNWFFELESGDATLLQQPLENSDSDKPNMSSS